MDRASFLLSFLFSGVLLEGFWEGSFSSSSELEGREEGGGDWRERLKEGEGEKREVRFGGDGVGEKG